VTPGGGFGGEYLCCFVCCVGDVVVVVPGFTPAAVTEAKVAAVAVAGEAEGTFLSSFVVVSLLLLLKLSLTSTALT
jgi:hypothetical protein